MGNKYKTVTGTTLGRNGSQFTASMRITQQTPAPADLTATTPFVTIEGDIKDFDQTPGCNISFRGSGTNTQ